MARRDGPRPIHQAHMTVIKLALIPHNISYSQFANFMKDESYPFRGPEGTRKQKLQATSDVIRDDPDSFHSYVRDSVLPEFEEE